MRKKFYLNGSLKSVINIEELSRDYGHVIIEDTLPGYLPEEVGNPIEGQAIYNRDEGSAMVYILGRWVTVVA